MCFIIFTSLLKYFFERGVLSNLCKILKKKKITNHRSSEVARLTVCNCWLTGIIGFRTTSRSLAVGNRSGRSSGPDSCNSNLGCCSVVPNVSLS